jgi:predicted TIM-barrel fold metal-dependent hydrolase
MHRNFLTLLLVLLFYPKNSQSQDLTFEAYNPESTLVVPEHPITRAKFPVVDIHSHHRDMSDGDLSLLIKAMDTLNLAVLVNLSGGSGDRIVGAMANINKNYPDRFLLFANVDFERVGEADWGTRAATQLRTDVENGAVGLKIFKSLGLRYQDIKGNRIPVDDPRLDPVWEMCATLSIPVLIHAADPKSFWDPMDAQNERWLELKTRPGRKRSATDPVPWEQIIAEQHNLFRNHPKTTFINAHMGWYANNLDRLSELMEEFPNMYVGIGAIIAELGRQPRRAKAFFIQYQDRILFGKDSWQPSEFPTYFRVLETSDEYFPYHKKYHAFWAMYGLDLPDEVLRKVYYKNALKILPKLNPSLFPKS